MIELPAALAPWAAELSLLSGELALTLAPWVGRLAVALGALSESRTSESAEPDGYGGLARRGSYERLITGEWALAELFPDEFLRRAATGEHLFLDLVRRGPRAAQRSVAIVSAGPSQLGAPRLAHLAALIVLARRAASAGATFSWGLLEDPSCQLVSGLDGPGIRRLLDGRTARTAGEAAVSAWRAALVAPTDWWLIGAPELARWGRGASCLAVRDVLEPGARALEIDVVRRGPPARLRLELPAPEVCGRLLRDPLAQGGGTRVAALRGTAQRLRFVSRGLKLLGHDAAGGIMTWPIPGSPREPIGSVRRWPRWGTTVALGMRGRQLLGVWIDPRNPTALRVSEGGANPAITATLPAPIVEGLRPLLASGVGLDIGACKQVTIRPWQKDIVLQGPLYRMYLIAGVTLPAKQDQTLSATPFVVGTPDAVVASALLRDRDALWAQAGRDGEVQIVRLTEAGTAVVARTHAELGAATAVHWGRPGKGSPGWGPVAVHQQGGDWAILQDGQPPTLERADAPVVGLDVERGGIPRLITLEGERRLAWGHGAYRHQLPPTESAIVEVAVSPDEPRLAWLTADGEVVVYSLSHHAVLMRLVPGAGAAA